MSSPSTLEPPGLAVPIEAMRQQVRAGASRTAAWRQAQLQRLDGMLQHHWEPLTAALGSDLGKPPLEATMELLLVRQELRLCRRRLNRWMAPRPLPTALHLLPAKAWQQAEPLGCVLIISPWNYPLQLCLQPLVNALAAGNTAVLKPSEHAPATARLLGRLIRATFDAEVVQVVEGDSASAAALLEQRFDHIVFTGSGRVGQLVLEAAARHLTPVTLELGGKSPALVLADAAIEVTARRLIWGKGYNAGQTCVAPDYLLVERSVQAPLLAALRQEHQRLYGDTPLTSPDLGAIVNQAQFSRLEALLRQAHDRGQVLFGGNCDPLRQRIEPTVVQVTSGDDPLLQDELFGPILPVLAIDDLQQALAFINGRPQPLALYLFSQSSQLQQQVLAATSSGTVVINDVILQASDANLPFGGVGPSGMGRYHGQAGFDALSHLRTVLQRPTWGDVPFRYPPYNTRSLALLRRLLG
jgi:aldehyde dehydrogenase (NAD+)